MSQEKMIAYAEELTELIQVKTDQMNSVSAMLSAKALQSVTTPDIIHDQEAHDSFEKKKWLIELEIEELKTKHRNVMRNMGLPTPEDIQDEHEAWLLRSHFNSMVHAHEIMKMTSGEMERIHATGRVLKSDQKAYWQHQIATCDKAIASYLSKRT
jgi:hypothetical protein